MTNRLSVGAVVCVVASFGAGCGASSPIRPAPVTAEAATLTAGSEIVFGLAEGTMILTSAKGTISGSYSGQAKSAGTGEEALITVALTGGTGQFSGVSGTLNGIGTGGFAGEGDFSIVMAGTVSTGQGPRPFRLSLRGTSALSCAGGTVILTQHGTGTATATGRITASLNHVVVEAGCDQDPL